VSCSVFLIPVAVVSAGADRAPGPLPLLLVVLAGAGEGTALGWAQSQVLRPPLPGLSTTAWTARTAAAAAPGLARRHGTEHRRCRARRLVTGRPRSRRRTCRRTGSVLYRRGPVDGAAPGAAGSARWIGWTAAGWLAGLAVFLGVAPPLWHAGQGVGQAALVGALAGVGMSATMAAVTGRGLVRLLRGPPFRQ
jgi:hypothetical protein